MGCLNGTAKLLNENLSVKAFMLNKELSVETSIINKAFIVDTSIVCSANAKPILPYDAEIEYLESSGTQYIQTNFTPNQDTIIESEVYLPDFAMNKHFIYGAGISHQSKNMEVYTWNDVTMNVNGNRALSTRGVPTTEFIKLFMSSSRISISNHQNELIAESTFTTNDFTCTSSLILFGIRRGKIFFGRDKIKSIKVNNGNIPVLDFIPVRIGTVGYMYDKVSKQLFGNTGTGEFILGPDK